MRKIPEYLTKRYVAEGWWTQETLGDLVAGGLAANPATAFNVHSAVRPYSGTFDDVETEARRLAAGLRSRGVGAGDVVAIQLPNWMEAAAAFWAATFLGAVVVPIVHFYGRKELGHIMTTARPKVFITTAEFGRMTFQADLCADVPIVGLVGDTFDDLLADDPMPGTIGADPASPALIAFTSGTTSNPKGHSQPPDPRLRDASAPGELPARPRQAADGDPGGALHRDARRISHPGARRSAHRSV